MVQQNQPTKSKMQKQREKNVKFLKSIPSVISGAFKGEYSTAAAAKRKKEIEKKKEEATKRRKALMAEKRKTAAEKRGMRKEAAKYVSGLEKKARDAKKTPSKKTSSKKTTAEKIGMRKDAAKYVLGLEKKAKDAKKAKGTKDPDASRKQQTQIKKPRTVAEAQKAGLLYFRNKDGEKRLAITSAQLKKFQKKHGITSYSKALTKFANMYKPGSGMAKFKADMKKK